jgi:hypothetical protein
MGQRKDVRRESEGITERKKGKKKIMEKEVKNKSDIYASTRARVHTTDGRRGTQDKRRFILPRTRQSLRPLLEAVGLWAITRLLKQTVWTIEIRNVVAGTVVAFWWIFSSLQLSGKILRVLHMITCYLYVRFASDVQGIMTLTSYLRCCLGRLT